MNPEHIPATAQEIEKLRAEHQPFGSAPRFCQSQSCLNWPCPTIRVIWAWDALREDYNGVCDALMDATAYIGQVSEASDAR